MNFEYDLIKFFQAGVSTGWLTFFQAITALGSFLGFFITFLFVFIKDKRLTIALTFTFALASIINHFLKTIIGRARPFDQYSDIINYGNEDGFSMPSGHSLCAGIFATYLMYVLVKYNKDIVVKILGGITISLFPPLIALSRMVLGVHYLTDTLVGMTLGILFAIFSIMIYNCLRKRMKNGKNIFGDNKK